MFDLKPTEENHPSLQSAILRSVGVVSTISPKAYFPFGSGTPAIYGKQNIITAVTTNIVQPASGNPGSTTITFTLPAEDTADLVLFLSTNIKDLQGLDNPMVVNGKKYPIS